MVHCRVNYYYLLSNPNGFIVNYQLNPSACLQGEIVIPGDKSISHRALLCGAIADGITTIHGLLESEDCLATLHALQTLGVTIIKTAPETWQIHGAGRFGLGFGLHSPAHILDLKNAGTGLRLLTGLLAGANINAILTGDASLQKRPMQRILAPLSTMGAKITAQTNDVAPLTIQAQNGLRAIDYTLPIPSAQVKSCLLLAGLYASGTSIIREPIPCRDHTERLLQHMGAHIHCSNHAVFLEPSALKAVDLNIPADISSAAFFMVGASIAPGSDIIMKNVGINPTRTGIIDFLGQMGADITLQNNRSYGNEPIADIRVKYAPLQGITISPEKIPSVIDELPVLLIAAACAKNPTRVFGAGELTVKESNRLIAMQTGLRALGVTMTIEDDNITVFPAPFQGGTINSFDDHRIVMAFSMAALSCTKPITIQHCENVATSFPHFISCAKKAGLHVEIL